MRTVSTSRTKTTTVTQRLSAIWSDISHAQLRVIELNRPGRSSRTH